MNQFQEYFVHEFVEEYRVGHMTRRDMVRRVLYITGGVASTAALLGSLGVRPVAAAQTPPAPGPRATSPLSVAPEDPAVSTQWISFTNQNDGATIMAYEARPSGATEPLPVILVCMRNSPRKSSRPRSSRPRRTARGGTAARSSEFRKLG